MGVRMFWHDSLLLRSFVSEVTCLKSIMFLVHWASSINAATVVSLLNTRHWILVLGVCCDRLSTLLKAVCLFVFYPVSSDFVFLIMNCWQRTGIPQVKSQNKALHSCHLYYPSFLLILTQFLKMSKSKCSLIAVLLGFSLAVVGV